MINDIFIITLLKIINIPINKLRIICLLLQYIIIDFKFNYFYLFFVFISLTQSYTNVYMYNFLVFYRTCYYLILLLMIIIIIYF